MKKHTKERAESLVKRMTVEELREWAAMTPTTFTSRATIAAAKRALAKAEGRS